MICLVNSAKSALTNFHDISIKLSKLPMLNERVYVHLAFLVKLDYSFLDDRFIFFASVIVLIVLYFNC